MMISLRRAQLTNQMNEYRSNLRVFLGNSTPAAMYPAIPTDATNASDAAEVAVKNGFGVLLMVKVWGWSTSLESSLSLPQAVH
jgi:hypothetical protein